MKSTKLWIAVIGFTATAALASCKKDNVSSAKTNAAQETTQVKLKTDSTGGQTPPKPPPHE